MRNFKWVLIVLAALVLGVGAAACGGDDEEAATPAATTEAATEAATDTAAAETEAADTAAAPAECPLDDGEVNVFSVQDLSAVIGEEIGPAGNRAFEVWSEKTNGEGGILGCQVVVEVADDAFDIPVCLRLYRDALSEAEKYDVFIGPTNSACMFALDELTNQAGKPLISGIAADHQPFLEEFKSFNFHASVSTFLEGRASAVFAQEQGWKRMATIVPNYAYGQDAEKGFREYFTQVVPDGEIVERQFPEFDEKNFQPFINPITAADPDAVFSAFFGPFIVPLWKQWKATGHEDIPTISGLNVLATFSAVKAEGDIPENTYGYNRGPWQILSETPVGAELSQLYLDRYGDEHPLVSEFAYQIFSSLQLMKALVEQTQSTDAQAWVDAVEAGTVTFEGPYHAGPTPVNPINHMADNCVSVGHIVWDESLPQGWQATYDPDSYVTSCMHDVLTQEEAAQITVREGEIGEEALAAYEANVEAVKQADAEAGINE